MPSWITPGTIAGLLGLLAALAGAFGKPALAAFLQDPGTASTLLTVLGGAAALIAGALKGIETPAPTARK